MRVSGHSGTLCVSCPCNTSTRGITKIPQGGRNSAVCGSGRAIYCRKLGCALLYISERTLLRHRAFGCKRAGPGLVAQAVSHRSEWAPKSTQHPLLPPAPTSASARRVHNHGCNWMSVAWCLSLGFYVRGVGPQGFTSLVLNLFAEYGRVGGNSAPGLRIVTLVTV